MNLFYLWIIENYADLYNILFYVQTKNFIFLQDTLVFNIIFWNLACLEPLHDFLGNYFIYMGFSN